MQPLGRFLRRARERVVRHRARQLAATEDQHARFESMLLVDRLADARRERGRTAGGAAKHDVAALNVSLRVRATACREQRGQRLHR